MQMVTITLLAGDDAGNREITAAEIVAAIWAVGEPADGIEHVHAKAYSGRVDIVIFHRGDDTSLAIRQAELLALRACMRLPKLGGWHVWSG